MTKQTETPEQVNARVLATVTVDNDFISRFNQFRGKNWPTKWAGVEPSDAMFMVGALFTKSNHGTAECGFHALLLRDVGATDQQHGTAFNCKAAHNHMWHHGQGLTSLGYFKREQLAKSHWRVYFTPKGEKQLAALLSKRSAALTHAASQPVKQAKPKAKAKRKAKAKVSATVQAPAYTVHTSDAVDAPAIGTVDSEGSNFTPIEQSN